MNSYGRPNWKQLRLGLDISGKVDQKQLWAILDTVNSDDDGDIDNLLGDSDTDFEAITEDASGFTQ